MICISRCGLDHCKVCVQTRNCLFVEFRSSRAAEEASEKFWIM